MDLCEIYQGVNEIIKRLKFSELFPNFRQFKFALYNATEICFNGTVFPYHEGFKGNTSIEFRGDHIAIWNIDSQDNLDLDTLAHGLVHEMYHCYQQKNEEKRFPDDLKVLNRPLETEFYSLKHEENRCLATAYLNDDMDSFKSFFGIRNLRLSKYSEYVVEELKAETIEGVSEYIGLLALKNISQNKWQSQIEDIIRAMTSVSLLFDIKRAAYFTGTILCMTLEKLGYPIKNEFNELTLYEQNLLYHDCSYLLPLNAEISHEFQKIIEKDRSAIDDFIASKPYIDYSARICGYDPMNMIRVNELIYCKHFVALQNERESVVLNQPAVLKLKSNSDNIISGYYL